MNDQAMQASRGKQIQLPPVIKFTLPSQHAITILEALTNHGPYKVVHSVIENFEHQLLAQQVREPVLPLPPATLKTAPVEVPASPPVMETDDWVDAIPVPVEA